MTTKTKAERIAEVKAVCKTSPIIQDDCCHSCHTGDVEEVGGLCCLAEAQIRSIEAEEASND